MELASLRWHWFGVRLYGAANYDFDSLCRWFWKWFDEDKDGEREPIGAVHSLSDPIMEGETASLHVNLGSAPVESFEDLLDALAATGATRCKLSA